MAQLDVVDVLLDPDFMDTGLVCNRMAQTVDVHGRAQNASTAALFAAVVTSDKGDILQRGSDNASFRHRNTLGRTPLGCFQLQLPM